MLVAWSTGPERQYLRTANRLDGSGLSHVKSDYWSRHPWTSDRPCPRLLEIRAVLQHRSLIRVHACGWSRLVVRDQLVRRGDVMTLAPQLLRPIRPEPRRLLDLAHELGLDVIGDLEGLSAIGIASRTSELAAGYMFAALPGAVTHGALFAVDAARAGAIAVLTDGAGASGARASGLPLLVSAEPRRMLGPVAAWLHRTAERMPLLLGVTGTNGKTTTVHLLQQVLDRLGTPTGVSSTAERGFGDEQVPSRLTTPESDELHALLARMSESGVHAAAIEVSAQALARHRVGGLHFDVVGFTNLSHDHLDDFADMHQYLLAKSALFEEGVARRAVICVDTEGGRRLKDLIRIPTVTVSSSPAVPADWQVRDVEVRLDGTRFTLTSPSGEVLKSQIDALGSHQAVDAAIAIVMTIEAGYPPGRVAGALAPDGLQMPVHGRLERIPGSRAPAVYIDVGHTPDAIAKSLAALRVVTRGPLVVLFGADGDRDPSKRGPMGLAAGELADVVVVHDHHSRFEDPDTIRAAVLAGAQSTNAHVLDIPCPVNAIREALGAAGPDGTVLWAGTGRTDYRDIGGIKHRFSFWDEAGRAVEERDSAAETREAAWNAPPLPAVPPTPAG